MGIRPGFQLPELTCFAMFLSVALATRFKMSVASCGL